MRDNNFYSKVNEINQLLTWNRSEYRCETTTSRIAGWKCFSRSTLSSSGKLSPTTWSPVALIFRSLSSSIMNFYIFHLSDNIIFWTLIYFMSLSSSILNFYLLFLFYPEHYPSKLILSLSKTLKLLYRWLRRTRRSTWAWSPSGGWLGR